MKNINRFTSGVDVDENANQQIINVAGMPFVEKVAVMPDAHFGVGCTVGSVIAQKNAIIPAAVGVDIGCGMNAVKTSLKSSDLPDNLFGLRCKIESMIPHGRSNGGQKGDVGAWSDLPEEFNDVWIDLSIGFNKIIEKHPKISKCNSRNHLGTLGTGNHFIEICLDLDDSVWIMLHSGSRGVGNKIGTYFIEKAKEEMKRWFINLPDIDLAYLPHGSKYFDDYFESLYWAQSFAKMNREIMMSQVILALKTVIDKNFSCKLEAINCHHNYVSVEKHFGSSVFITRKGAIKAEKGDLGIIPGSMGAKSFIVKGKGNIDSLNSCSHGAGRVLSRNEARKRFTKEELLKQTSGVECRKDEDLVDEIPSAYKNIEDVMNAQKDLVDIVYELKQILCVKG